MISPIRVGACHVSPVFLSAKATTEKAISLIHQASHNKANLVVFPETYIPAFPHWSALRAPTENHDLFRRMAQESIHADGEEINLIRSAAKATKTIVNIGFSEKARASSTATSYNSNLLIGQQGEILVHHRKLVPTFFEKLTWSPGDGHGLRVASTPYGKIGALICGENTNPLARYTMMAQGEQLHISTWPAVWPTRYATHSNDTTPTPPSSETDHPPKTKNYNNVAANRTRAAAHSFEAKCFSVLCSSHLDAATISLIASDCSNPVLVRKTLETSSRGATMYLDPTGAVVPGFTISSSTHARKEHEYLQDEEDVLYADLDLAGGLIEEGKQYHDVTGGYQRFDVFELRIDRRRKEAVVFRDA